MGNQDNADLLVGFAKYIVKRAIVKMRETPDGHLNQWKCTCCSARANRRIFDVDVDVDKEAIQHQENCTYVQAKTVLLLNPEKE